MKSLKESLFDRDLVSKDIKFTFAGLEINPMPVIYKHGKFQFAKSWDELSYKKVFGLEEGSTYFNWDQCHNLKIDRWRVPTEREWQAILDRELHVYVKVGKEQGYILFPDNYEKKNLDILTKSQLEEYINRGCIFLPFTGYCGGIRILTWYSQECGEYWSSTERSGVYSYFLQCSRGFAGINNASKTNIHLPIILTKKEP